MLFQHRIYQGHIQTFYDMCCFNILDVARENVLGTLCQGECTWYFISGRMYLVLYVRENVLGTLCEGECTWYFM